MNVCISDEVYARCSDGVAYHGTVTQIDTIRNEVEVKGLDVNLTKVNPVRAENRKIPKSQKWR